MKDWFVSHKYYVVAAVIIAFGCGYYFFIYQPSTISNQSISKLEKNNQSNSEQIKMNEQQPQPQHKSTEMIMIDIKGEIKKPGVYQSSQGERVIDVIKRAGGLTDKADESQINFAAHVQDEMVINVPSKGQEGSNPPTSSPSSSTTANSSGLNTNKINLNRADESELQNLPGIGPSKATAIITFRNENGPYQSIDDLKKVTGIGDKTFEKLKESITVQ